MSKIPSIKELTDWIDKASYKELLRRWRFGTTGDPIFRGNTGKYYHKVMSEKKQHVDHVAISKEIGW